MRTKNIILLAVIACIGVVAFFFACKHTYTAKVYVLEQKAKETLFEALKQELKNRKIEGALSLRLNVQVVDDDLPDSVCIVDSLGMHWYRLDPKKHPMNITDDTSLRAIHSTTFREHPISSDSINALWKKYLLESHVNAESAVCISVMNEKGEVKSQNKSLCEWCNLSNLVYSVYLGYACEIEVKGYLHYSVWDILGVDILLYLLLYILSVYGIYKIGIATQEKIVSLKRKNTIEVIKVVKEMDGTPIRSYKLKEGMIFYAEMKKVELNGKEISIPPQANKLLEMFLINKKKEYILEDDEILENLWPDELRRMENVHKAVDRLRKLLQKLDLSFNIVRGVGLYQLLL